MQQAEVQPVSGRPPGRGAPGGGRGRAWARRLFAGACWLYPVVALALWGVLYAASDRWWLATVLMFSPRWLWAVPAVFLVPAGALWRRRLLWPLGVAVFVLVFPVMGLCVPWPDFSAADAGSPTLRVLTCNIHQHELDATALGELIADARPDVVALQEWVGRHEQHLFGGEGWHVRGVGELVLASRYPVGRVEVLKHRSFEDGNRGAVAAFDLDTPAGPVRFVNVHLDSPHHGLQQFLSTWGRRATTLKTNSHRRRIQSQETVRWLEGWRGPLLLAGDFNTPPDSTIYRECWSRFTNAFSERGLGFGLTFYTHPGAVRIDHVLAGPGWRCLGCRVGPDVGSAHRPVLAEFAWEGPPAGEGRPREAAP